MSAQDWFRNSRGEWYVIGQGALAVLVLLAPMIVRGPPSISHDTIVAVTAVGAALCALGFAFLALGARSLGSSVSPFPRPKEGARLVETGVYSIVRHPIYAGLTFLAVGYSLIWLSWPGLVATAALFIFLDIKARREERWLEEEFAGYGAYRARVKKLIPFMY
jgi:protein-S-isoprenylcysteine O-methyltransferase Ste14